MHLGSTKVKNRWFPESPMLVWGDAASSRKRIELGRPKLPPKHARVLVGQDGSAAGSKPLPDFQHTRAWH